MGVLRLSFLREPVGWAVSRSKKKILTTICARWLAKKSQSQRSFVLGLLFKKFTPGWSRYFHGSWLCAWLLCEAELECGVCSFYRCYLPSLSFWVDISYVCCHVPLPAIFGSNSVHTCRKPRPGKLPRHGVHITAVFVLLHVLFVCVCIPVLCISCLRLLFTVLPFFKYCFDKIRTPTRQTSLKLTCSQSHSLEPWLCVCVIF